MQEQHRLKAEKAQANLDDQNAKLDQAEQDIKALQRALGAQEAPFVPKPVAQAPQCSPEQWAAFLLHQANLETGAAEEAEQARQAAHIEAIAQVAVSRKIAEDAGTFFTEAKKQQKALPTEYQQALDKFNEANSVLKQQEEKASTLAKGGSKGAARSNPY
jgi:hypothetical protein